VYGPDAPADLRAETPHLAKAPLGRLKAEAAAAYCDADLPVTVLRGGDFFDTRASGNWFNKVLAAKARRGRLTYPGALDRPHAWAFLPDMARAAVALAEQRGRLPRHHEVLFPGYTLTGAGLAQVVGDALQRQVTPRGFSWWQIQAARPFWPDAKHLIEMRYLWDTPHRVDPAGFDALLPAFQPTPLPEAVQAALAPLSA
jgi:nucleoside-diphosphate-sugar epimerase